MNSMKDNYELLWIEVDRMHDKYRSNCAECPLNVKKKPIEVLKCQCDIDAEIEHADFERVRSLRDALENNAECHKAVCITGFMSQVYAVAIKEAAEKIIGGQND